MIKLLIPFALLLQFSTAVLSSDELVDLKALEDRAAQHGGVCAIYVYRDGCPYCRALEAEVLGPMTEGGEFDDLCLSRLNWEGQVVLDLSGREVTSEELVKRYGVIVVPTIVFVDAAGDQLTQPLIGYQSSELYFGLLRKRFRQAYAREAGKLR